MPISSFTGLADLMDQRLAAIRARLLGKNAGLALAWAARILITQATGV